MVEIKKKYRLTRIRKRNFFIDEEDYPVAMIKEELENDEINSREEGFWIGYTRA